MPQTFTPDARRPALRDAVTRAADAGERHFTLDLTGVSGVDGTALSVFVELLKRVRGDGGAIWVAGACLSVRRVFEITCLSRVFGMADLDAAA